MSIKYNEVGEVLSVNSFITGQQIGTVCQDAAGTPECNEPYYEERHTTRCGEEMCERNDKNLTWIGWASNSDLKYGMPFMYENKVYAFDNVHMLSLENSIWKIEYDSPQVGARAGDVWTHNGSLYFTDGDTTGTVKFNGTGWEPVEDNGSAFYGRYVWSDGERTFYSDGEQDQFIFIDGIWEPFTWNGDFADVDGHEVWHHNGNIYYSKREEQYVLNKQTDTWEEKKWNNAPSNLNGYSICEINGNVYWLDSSPSPALLKEYYVLNGETWENIDSNILLQGSCVWSDGINTYYAGSETHNIYKLLD